MKNYIGVRVKRYYRTEIGCHDFVIDFFFQAEDGIRDLIVTGVQTCALPIWGDIEFGKKNQIDYGKIGTGKSGFGTIKSEIDVEFNFQRGTVGLARTLKFDTEDSQFFIILDD